MQFRVATLNLEQEQGHESAGPRATNPNDWL